MGMLSFAGQTNAAGDLQEKIDLTDFIIKQMHHLCDKSNYGDAIDKLNSHERVFFAAQLLEQEVNNGGFDQYFSNSSGNLANEIVAAFREIGAPKTAAICEKALSVFHGSVPTDWDVRQDLLEELDCGDVWDECDDAFYEYEENLDALHYQYVLAHRDSFDL